MVLFPNYFDRLKSGVLIYGEGDAKAELKFSAAGKAVFDDVCIECRDGKVYVSAKTTPVSWVILRFAGKLPRGSRIYGDDWERGYGTLHWGGIVPERHMPWYFLAYQPEKKALAGYGVQVRPCAMCAWHVDDEGAELHLDVRSGGMGVLLNGRVLHAATLISSEYRDVNAFTAGHEFCKLMCPDPIFPSEPVYGSNNWYYAYGKSSRGEILTDAEYAAELTEGLRNRPYMVIDDGWQKNSCAGPWDVGNEKFGDMKTLAAEMKARGVKPGIWTRPLCINDDGIPEEWRSMRDRTYLDPSCPEVLEYAARDIRRYAEWGYGLIKHDYSSYDIFGRWGINMKTSVTDGGWHFRDRTKTSAEVVVEFYRTIREAAGSAVIIGCNTFSHLCAGLVEVNRTGDDTSGRVWNQTRNRGVNTLAFRMMQNRAFYMADADCAGITEAVPWKLNRQWLRALSRSGSPLFISSAKGVADEAAMEEMREAYAYSSKQTDVLAPLDWLDTVCPERWNLNGVEIAFNWYDE